MKIRKREKEEEKKERIINWKKKRLVVATSLDWLQSFLFYIYFSLSLHYFFIMILFNPTSSYLCLNKNDW